MTKWIAFWMTCVIYGSGFMFTEIALEELTPLQLTAIQLTIGAISLTLYTRLSGVKFPPIRPLLGDFVVLSLMNVVVPLILIAWAQQQTLDSGIAGVLIATNPIFALIFAHLFFDDDRMTTMKVVGVVVGFSGTAILAARNFSGDGLGMDGLAGQLAIITASMMFAISGVYSRKLMQKGVDSVVVSAGTQTTAMVVIWLLLGSSVALGQDSLPNFAALAGGTIASFMILGILNRFLAFTLNLYVLLELGVTRSSMITYVIPIVSLSAGYFFLDEVLDAYVIVGTIIILCGIAVVNTRWQPRKRKIAALSTNTHKTVAP